MENEITTGYNVVNISSGQTEKFLRTTGDSNQERIGKFYIYNEGLHSGIAELLQNKEQLIVIDEIGKLELEGKGWSATLRQILSNSEKAIYLFQ